MKEKPGYFYFTRHGETYWNVENKICGATDIALTPHGHKQAVELGKLVQKQCPDVTQILCSPLSRARETARHVSEITGIPMRCDERLTEQNFGRYEGTARDGKEFHEAKKHFVCSFDSGETMLRVAQRVYNLLDEIRESDEVYLLVAHNGITRIIQSYFTDMTEEEFSSFGIRNCEIRKFTFHAETENGVT